MSRHVITEKMIRAQVPAARRRARQAVAAEPRAKRARYDRNRGLVVVELTNGAFFGFPARLGQGLRGGSPKLLGEVEVSPSGEALHWELLDVDLRVAALLQGVFGTRTWMREIGRTGGRARSDAKARAARANGARGGRPRKRSVS